MPLTKSKNYERPTTPQWRRPKLVTVYLVKHLHSKSYKIGYTSRDIKDRLGAIKNLVGQIILIGCTTCEFKYEPLLHERFKNKRVDIFGYTEYFSLSKSDVNFVLSLFKIINKQNGSTTKK